MYKLLDMEPSVILTMVDVYKVWANLYLQLLRH